MTLTTDAVEPLSPEDQDAWRSAHRLKAGTFDLGKGRHGVCGECFQQWPCSVSRMFATLEARLPLDATTLGMALHKTRRSNDDPEFDLGVAEHRAEAILAALREAKS